MLAHLSDSNWVAIIMPLVVLLMSGVGWAIAMSLKRLKSIDDNIQTLVIDTAITKQELEYLTELHHIGHDHMNQTFQNKGR